MSDQEVLEAIIAKRVSWPSLHWGDFGHREAHAAIAKAILDSEDIAVMSIERHAALCGRIEELEAALSEITDAGNDLCLRLITVKPTLEKPYPDDARWSPWTRFIEDRWRRLGRAVTASWKVVPKPKRGRVSDDAGDSRG